jgi:PAS domain S-box-containing protein
MKLESDSLAALLELLLRPLGGRAGALCVRDDGLVIASEGFVELFGFAAPGESPQHVEPLWGLARQRCVDDPGGLDAVPGAESPLLVRLLPDSAGRSVQIRVSRARSQRLPGAYFLVARQADSENWDRRVIDTAMEGIWALDVNALTTYVNPRLLEMLGYSEGEMLGRSLYEFVEATHVEEARRYFVRHREGQRHVLEFPFRRKDGSELNTIVSATPIVDDAGRFIGAIGMLTDITERVREERERLVMIERQNVLLDHVPALIIFKDTENNILLTTESVARATGLPRDRIEGRHSSEIYPDMADRYYSDDLEVMKSGRPKLGIVEPLRGVDGGVRWLRTDKVPYRDTNGGIAGIVVFAVDITELKAAELALTDSERRYRTLYEQIPQGVVLHGTDGRIVEANPAACRILGLDREQMFGLSSTSPQWRCIHEDGSDFPGTEHPAMQALRSGAPVSGVVMGVSGGNRPGVVWILIDAVPLFDPLTGESAGVFASFSDITESRQWQQALVQSQKMEAIGQLAGGIAHDFNNILGSVLGFCELAQMQAEAGDARLNGYLHQIDKAAERARDLVRQLLVFSRGESTGAARAAPLDSMIDGAVELLRPLLPPTVDVVVEFPGTVPVVAIDPLHLQQILLNLGLNASDAMSGKGCLGIRIEEMQVDDLQCAVCGQRVTGSWASVSVRDSGRGIESQHMHSLFQPFFSTKPVGAGSGMGLAVVAGLLRTYGGHVSVESVPGRGARFDLFLPLCR